RQANDSARAVANGGDTMQRAFDAGPIVVAKLTDIVGNVVEVGGRDRVIRQQDLATWDARLWLPAEVQDDLQELPRIDALMKGAREVWRQGPRQPLNLLVPGGGAELAVALASRRARPN